MLETGLIDIQERIDSLDGSFNFVQPNIEGIKQFKPMTVVTIFIAGSMLGGGIPRSDTINPDADTSLVSPSSESASAILYCRPPSLSGTRACHKLELSFSERVRNALRRTRNPRLGPATLTDILKELAPDEKVSTP